MISSRVMSSAAGLAMVAGLLVLPAAPAAAAAEVTDSASSPGRIVFYSQRAGNGLWSVPGDGGALTEVDTGLSGTKPDLSPSGARVAFTAYVGSATEVFTASSTGGAARRMTTDNTTALDPAWSPDGTQIAYSGVVAGQRDVWLRPMAGGSMTRVTNDSAADIQPTWAPDRTRLAYVKITGGVARIHVVNADGTGDRQLVTTAGSERHPDWSPDGTKIAFTSYSSTDGQGDIFVMNADGTGAAPLAATAGAYETEPSWSPDGTRLAYRSSASGFDDIWTMSATGTGRVNLTNDSAVDDQPSWGRTPPPAGTPSITVTPHENLDPAGQSVTVVGSGFTPETTILLSQCGTHDNVSCLQGPGAVPAADGTFTASMQVADRFGPTQYCSTALSCWVRASSFDSWPNESADHPISFQGAPPPAAPTATTLTSSSNPSTEGAEVTFTATVGPTETATGTPDGSVTFTVNGTAGTPVALVGGQATWSTSSLVAGDHSVSATYSGSTSYQGSTSPTLTQTVNPAPPPTPRITVTPSEGLNPYGETVRVVGSGFPAGGAVVIRQCADPTSTSTRCSPSVSATADASGSFSSSLLVTYAMAEGSCVTNCRVQAQHPSSTPPVIAEQSISFAAAVPASTVTPSTDLHPYGHAITVSGSGFPAGARLTVMQCTDPTRTSTACHQLAYPEVSAQGTYTVDVTVTLAMPSGHTCSTNCRMRTYLASSPPVMTEQPITFGRAPKLAVTATPYRNLPRGGSTVQVAWSGFPANTALVVSQCSGTTCVSKQTVGSGSGGSSATFVTVAYALGSGTCSSRCRIRVAIAGKPTLFGEARLAFARS